MTPDTPTPRPPRDGDDRPRPARAGVTAPATATAAVALAVLVGLALAATAAGVGATATQDGPTVRVTDASLDPGGTASVRVVLASAPEGLAGYELVLSVADGEAATVAGANYTDDFGLTTEPAVSEDGRTVRLEAADVGGNVQAGATDVALATVELRAETAGEARLEVRPVQFDADGGARMNVSVEAGSVVVGEPEPTATVAAEPTAAPTDGTATADGAGAASDGGTAATATRTDTTSGQGGLPLAGVGAAAVAIALVGALLARRR
jgi:hypothetical protein